MSGDGRFAPLPATNRGETEFVYWAWILDLLQQRPALGKQFCDVEHVGLVVSWCATAAIEGGDVVEVRAGDVFDVPPGPPGHDSWVVGNEPYVSLHLLGASHYAAAKRSVTAPILYELAHSSRKDRPGDLLDKLLALASRGRSARTQLSPGGAP